MGDVVNFPTALIDDADFVLALARFADGLETEAAVKKRFKFTDDVWDRLGENDALVAKIEETKRRRVADGSTARERAQVLFATAPQRLGEILNSPASSPRHVIGASKEIRAVAAVGPEAALATDRFQIVLNLGGDVVERYDKSRAITNDNPNDTAPQKLVAVIAANKIRITAVGNSLFERLRPPPTKKAQKPSPPQRLLDWLQHWPESTIRARDIRIYGPNSIRDRESAIDSAEILVKNGWLVPIKTRRRDMHEWQIVRKPIIRPTVATVAGQADGLLD
jgi:hypothetical protein